jgi:hypothetical protein
MEQQTQTGPIFIVGMNGSGTTMLADSLDNSPELYVFPRETRMIPWLVENLASFGDLTRRENREKLVQTICNFNNFRRVAPNLTLSDQEISEPSLFGVIDAVYGHLARAAGKARWVEKSPMNVQFLPQIAQQMPTAKFIHIIRDGRDIAQSNNRRWRKNPYWSIHRWSQVVPQGQADGRRLGPERYLEIRYEEFTSEPEAGLRTICDFVGIAYTPELLRSSMPFMNMSERRVKDKAGTIVANSQKWRSYFSPQEVVRLESIAGKVLADLGYEPANPNGSYTPSQLQFALWRYLDIGLQGLLVIQRRGVQPFLKQRLWRRLAEGLKYRSVLRH